MMFAGMLRYRMHSETYAQLTNLGEFLAAFGHGEDLTPKIFPQMHSSDLVKAKVLSGLYRVSFAMNIIYTEM
jgi:hypothetical protein